VRWSPNLSPAGNVPGISVAFRRSVSPTLKSSPPALSPEAAEAAGVEFETGLFPFQANSRAMTLEQEAGLSASSPGPTTTWVLGIQGWVPGSRNCRPAFCLAIEMGARLEDIAGTIHAHPTQSESMAEAAFKALGHPLHLTTL